MEQGYADAQLVVLCEAHVLAGEVSVVGDVEVREHYSFRESRSTTGILHVADVVAADILLHLVEFLVLNILSEQQQFGGVVHTHSPEAVAWAQAGRDIPLYGTTHADYFLGPIPCARNLTTEEINEAYEKNTGLVIIETFEERKINPVYTPAVLCKNHGPFTWGKDAAEAVHNAVVLEEVAKMARNTELINPDVKPAPDNIKEKHFYRKHGANAYYGQ